jgi:hypothetical protein
MSVTIPLRTLVAFGTGVAVALIAVFVFQAWRVDAAPGDSDTTFVPVVPCRLIDTRPNTPGQTPTNVGPRNTPIPENHPVMFTAWGSGDVNSVCEIPASATAISTNTTTVNPTAYSFVTLYPADKPLPDTSNLNLAPGQAATPNAVTTPLSSTGQFNVFNRFGTVDVIVDINGYYTKSSTEAVAALQTQVTEHQSDIDGLTAEVKSLGESQPFVVTSFDHDTTDLALTPASYLSISVRAPVEGHVTVHSLAAFEHGASEGADVLCIIEAAADVPADNLSGEYMQFWETGGVSNETSFSGSRTFEISAGATTDYVLACQAFQEFGTIQSRNMTAIFTPGQPQT